MAVFAHSWRSWLVIRLSSASVSASECGLLRGRVALDKDRLAGRAELNDVATALVGAHGAGAVLGGTHRSHTHSMTCDSPAL